MTIFPHLEALRDERTKVHASAPVSALLAGDLSVITSTFDRAAKIPKDSIIGLLAVLRCAIFGAVPITKEATEREVFTAICIAVLKEQDEIDNLALLHYTDTEDRNPRLPSWVPNFHSRQRLHLLSPFSRSGRYLYEAGPRLLDTNPERVRFRPGLPNGPPILQIKGRVIDRIIAVIPGHDSGWQHIDFLNAAAHEQDAWEEQCHALVSKHAKGKFSLVDFRPVYEHKPIADLPQSYVATLVAGSAIRGKSRVRSAPTWKTWASYKWRLGEMTKPEYDDFYTRLHENENPGASLSIEEINRGDMHLRGEEKEEYHARMVEVCRGRSFFITAAGRMGLGGTVEIGDGVVLFGGGRTPFIVRELIMKPVKDGEGFQAVPKPPFQLIGETYVHGVMDGEGCTRMSGRKDMDHWITLK